jgi:hypothetical protein
MWQGYVLFPLHIGVLVVCWSSFVRMRAVRMYQSPFVADQKSEDMSFSEGVTIARQYVGRTLTLMTRAGSALVQVDMVEGGELVYLTRCCRASATTRLVVPLAAFLASLDCGALSVCC